MNDLMVCFGFILFYLFSEVDGHLLARSSTPLSFLTPLYKDVPWCIGGNDMFADLPISSKDSCKEERGKNLN